MFKPQLGHISQVASLVIAPRLSFPSVKWDNSSSSIGHYENWPRRIKHLNTKLDGHCLLLWALPSPGGQAESVGKCDLLLQALPPLGLLCHYVLQDTVNSPHQSNMKSLRQNNK